MLTSKMEMHRSNYSIAQAQREVKKNCKKVLYFVLCQELNLELHLVFHGLKWLQQRKKTAKRE